MPNSPDGKANGGLELGYDVETKRIREEFPLFQKSKRIIRSSVGLFLYVATVSGGAARKVPEQKHVRVRSCVRQSVGDHRQFRILVNRPHGYRMPTDGDRH